MLKYLCKLQSEMKVNTCHVHCKYKITEFSMMTLWCDYHNSHFIDENTEAENLSELPDVIWLINGEAGN